MQEERKKMEPETIFNIVRVSLIVVVIIACAIFIKWNVKYKSKTNVLLLHYANKNISAAIKNVKQQFELT